jgi:hypothetical protein
MTLTINVDIQLFKGVDVVADANVGGTAGFRT